VGYWPSVKAKQLRKALFRIGWTVKRSASGSHDTFERAGWPDYVFAFHDSDEIGPVMVGKVAKKTGLTRNDL
jgi:predicted RNA binding protein YcfA (HicA-like mRNA interferase family)